MEAGRWQMVTVLGAGQMQAVKAGKTFCSLSALGIEAIGSGRLPTACHKQAEGSKYCQYMSGLVLLRRFRV